MLFSSGSWYPTSVARRSAGVVPRSSPTIASRYCPSASSKRFARYKSFASSLRCRIHVCLSA